MTHAVDLALAVQTVSAFLYIALGAWVLTLKPRRPQTLLLGAFAVLFGGAFALFDVFGEILHWVPPDGLVAFLVLWLPLGVAAYAAAFGLAAVVSDRDVDRRLVGIAVVGGLVLTLATVVLNPFRTLQDAAYPLLTATGDRIARIASIGASLLLALRAGTLDEADPEVVIQLAVLAIAFAMLDAFAAGMAAMSGVDPAGRGALEILSVTGSPNSALAWLVVAGIWTVNMVRADGQTIRVHRAAALGILGLVAVGVFYRALFPAAAPNNNVMRGVMRTLGVGLLAYGVLRHDLAGLDAKVEWTVSKTTVAGVFVAVFFVVSEGAQVLFAGFAQSELLGIVAAGALLFALSPIQRLADRVAAKAVPGGAEEGQVAERSYRRAVRIALSDGEIERGEERELADLADDLGISAGRAFELREEVADEVGPDGGDTA